MNRLFCIALSVFLCSCAVTDKRHGGYHYTEGDAVSAAFDRFSAVSIQSDIEYGGYVYRDDNGYFYTYAKGLSSSGKLAFNRVVLGVPVIAMWHTHGNSDSDFSDQDIITANKRCITSYMMNKTDKLFIYKGCGYAVAK